MGLQVWAVRLRILHRYTLPAQVTFLQKDSPRLSESRMPSAGGLSLWPQSMGTRPVHLIGTASNGWNAGTQRELGPSDVVPFGAIWAIG